MTTKPHTANTDQNEKDSVEKTAEHVGRYARKVLEDAAPVNEQAEAFLNSIRDEPVKASLIALGVGVVLGMLLRR